MSSIIDILFVLKHLAVGLRRLIIGFIDRKDDPGGSDVYFASLFDPLYLFKFVIYVSQTHIGDILLVSKPHSQYFRCPPHHTHINFGADLPYVYHI